MNRFCQALILMLLLLSVSSCNTSQNTDGGAKNIMQPWSSSAIRLVVDPEKDGEEALNHKVYLDDSFIGNYNPSGSSDSRGMLLSVRCDQQHTIEIVSEGYRTQKISFMKLGVGTDQLIRFDMKKE